MLLFIPMLVFLQRDFGPMLVAERKCKVYDRTDGGDGKGSNIVSLSTGSEPETNTPRRWWNFFVPVFFLVFFIFYILVDYGDDGSGTQTVREKVENSDSWGKYREVISILDHQLYFILLTEFFSILQSLYCGEQWLHLLSLSYFSSSNSRKVGNWYFRLSVAYFCVVGLVVTKKRRTLHQLHS